MGIIFLDCFLRDGNSWIVELNRVRIEFGSNARESRSGAEHWSLKRATQNAWSIATRVADSSSLCAKSILISEGRTCYKKH